MKIGYIVLILVLSFYFTMILVFPVIFGVSVTTAVPQDRTVVDIVCSEIFDKPCWRFDQVANNVASIEIAKLSYRYYGVEIGTWG